MERYAATRIEAAGSSKQFGKDRICRFPNCNVRLSRYNPDEYCGVHVRARFEQVLVRRR